MSGATVNTDEAHATQAVLLEVVHDPTPVSLWQNAEQNVVIIPPAAWAKYILKIKNNMSWIVLYIKLCFLYKIK